MKRALALLCVCACGALAPIAAQAQLTLTFDNPNVFMNPNANVDITGVISNSSNGPITVDGSSLVGPLDSVTQQDTTEATVTDNFTPSNNFPIVVPANSSTSDLDFMTIHMGADVPAPTTIVGTYSVASSDNGIVANAPFSATRPVPEFSTSVMMLLGPGALAISRFRSRFKRAV